VVSPRALKNLVHRIILSAENSASELGVYQNTPLSRARFRSFRPLDTFYA
jgi:hypothetical protein